MKAAGVGIGTLYRHFPDREALVEAVYAAELDAIVAAAAGLAASEPPERALRAWFGRYGEFIAAKRGMADTLRSAFDAGPPRPLHDPHLGHRGGRRPPRGGHGGGRPADGRPPGRRDSPPPGRLPLRRPPRRTDPAPPGPPGGRAAAARV
ncbi:LOW QUALITY PROTEIN: tetR family transcriptional regulator, partial [Streptomyces sp. SPB78]